MCIKREYTCSNGGFLVVHLCHLGQVLFNFFSLPNSKGVAQVEQANEKIEEAYSIEQPQGPIGG